MLDRLVRVAFVVIAVAGLGACDLGAKQDLADRVAQARRVDTGLRVAVVTLAIQPKKVPAQAAAAQVGAFGAGRPYALFAAAIDTGTGTSILYAPPPIAARVAALTGKADAPAPLVFAGRNAIVVRRPARDVVAARPWYRLELDHVRDVTRPTVATIVTDRDPSDVAVLNPSFVVDLLSGVLAGSVSESGDTIRGRFSIDKANREDDLDDDAIDARREALRLFAVSDDVHAFTVQLGASGAIRRLHVEMVMKPDKQTRFLLTWDMRVQDTVPRVARPSTDESVRISSFNQVRAAITGWAAA